MDIAKKLRRSRVQTTCDPYELPLFSDSSSQDESSEDERGNDPIQQHDNRYNVILGPHLTAEHSSELGDPKSRKRGVKRKRPSEQMLPLSDQMLPLSDYLSFHSISKSHALPSPRREHDAIVSRPNIDEHGKSHKRRVPTLWDAQAGRLNFEGFIPRTPYYPDGRDRPSMRMNPIPPDVSVRHNAPAKYTDNLSQDFFPPDPNLPRRELVQALHAYASHFYAHVIPGGGEIDDCSLDGSALLAVAKLLETTVETIVGETGDLAFTEGASFDETGGPRPLYTEVGPWGSSVLEKGTFGYGELLNSQRELTEAGRAAKKAKLTRRSGSGASGGRSPRKSCTPCRAQSKKCDSGHPCARCIALELVDHCIYESDSGISRSQTRGRRNCKPCYRHNSACDHGHPCASCIKCNREDQCIYESEEEMTSKLSLSRTRRNPRSVSANSSRSSNTQISLSDLEERHSQIGTDEEQSSDEDGEAKAETVALAVRGRRVTGSSSADHSASRGRRSERSWSGRTPPTFAEERIEVDVDSLRSDGGLDTHAAGARLDAERDVSQPGSDLSGEQFGIGQGSSLTEFESDADEFDDEDAPLIGDDLDSSSQSDGSERESQFHIPRRGNGKDALMGGSENESELGDEDCSSFSDDDRGTNAMKA